MVKNEDKDKANEILFEAKNLLFLATELNRFKSENIEIAKGYIAKEISDLLKSILKHLTFVQKTALFQLAKDKGITLFEEGEREDGN